MTAFSFWPRRLEKLSSASAWGTVRGKAVEKEAALRVRRARCARRMSSITTSSGTRPPASIFCDELRGKRTFLLRGAEHVAGRDLRDPVSLADDLGLRALPGARRPDEHEPHATPRPSPSAADARGCGRRRPESPS